MSTIECCAYKIAIRTTYANIFGIEVRVANRKERGEVFPRVVTDVVDGFRDDLKCQSSAHGLAFVVGHTKFPYLL